MDDIRVRMYDNLSVIFGLPDQSSSQVEVVIGRTFLFNRKSDIWSPLDKSGVTGFVHRVVLHGHTAFLHGVVSAPHGREISSSSNVHSAAATTLAQGDTETAPVPIRQLSACRRRSLSCIARPPSTSLLISTPTLLSSGVI
ncbi:hypothetical protein CYLTODRAFT_460326 [Cylindrobasidium torrendii FP15055 ss-10]|uniref:Uncharacterized protein n=1 Tax=Cylindrobasidium torrendii FP15055 ss-10 TaxID=1314674 RepID=A0A0D7AUC8_9AGAR|nr:hypothetical protein CYLTODRAFT_460326 [Cylindrobasidium torrendii FP15055 ss-10]